MALDAHWNFSGCNDGGGGEQISSPFPIPSSLMLRQYFVLFLVSDSILLCSRAVCYHLYYTCEFLGCRDYGLFISTFSLAPYVSLDIGLFNSFSRY